MLKLHRIVVLRKTHSPRDSPDVGIHDESWNAVSITQNHVCCFSPYTAKMDQFLQTAPRLPEILSGDSTLAEKLAS